MSDHDLLAWIDRLISEARSVRLMIHRLQWPEGHSEDPGVPWE